MSVRTSVQMLLLLVHQSCFIVAQPPVAKGEIRRHNCSPVEVVSGRDDVVCVLFEVEVDWNGLAPDLHLETVGQVRLDVDDEAVDAVDRLLELVRTLLRLRLL